jgi:hypothetical protein
VVLFCNPPRPEENAVAAITAEHPFLVKHADKVSGVLSCFDRVIFRGYLPLSYPQGLEGFLFQQKVLLKDFRTYAPQVAERVKQHVKDLVAQAGAPFRHLSRKEPMEAQARRLAQETGLREGIVCGFSQLETCRTYSFQGGKDRPRLKKDYRRCLVLYVFLMHAVLGLIHVKIETWFPLTMQVYVNGHDFVARKLESWGVSYQLQDNAFTAIDNLSAAQACADRFAKQNWPKLLGALAGQFNPLVGRELRGQDYYWVMDQSEYATDVLFKDRSALGDLYPRLVEHARACLSAEDVLKFLGRKLTGHFQGEVQTQVGRRVEGVRVKHAMKSNKLKMYDKGGVVLRIETTINDPTEFRVRRKASSGKLAWQPLRKGVAWLWRYAEVSRTANGRYLEALAVVDDDSKARRLLDGVTKPAKWKGRRKRALQPLSAGDQDLFLAALRGEHRLHGFRNRDIAARLYPKVARDTAEVRRRCGRVTRLIQVLRAHGLVAKIPRTRRYRVTAKGELLMSAAIKVKEIHFPKEISQRA